MSDHGKELFLRFLGADDIVEFDFGDGGPACKERAFAVAVGDLCPKVGECDIDCARLGGIAVVRRVREHLAAAIKFFRRNAQLDATDTAAQPIGEIRVALAVTRYGAVCGIIGERFFIFGIDADRDSQSSKKLKQRLRSAFVLF